MSKEPVCFFDSFTKTMLAVGLFLLICIFCSAYYMDTHKMAAGGTDDAVNNMASQTGQIVHHHPLIELPGDSEVSAFSVANFFAGLIVGHNWRKLFEIDAKRKEEDEPEVA